MNSRKFLKCEICGNMVGMIHDSGMPITCCGKEMTVLEPNTTEAATEKHIPAVSVSGDTVTVQIGSVEHPMTEEHHIEFIYLQTASGGQRKSLEVGAKPIAEFKITEGTAVEVFAYCNLHGLWKADVNA